MHINIVQNGGGLFTAPWIPPCTLLHTSVPGVGFVCLFFSRNFHESELLPSSRERITCALPSPHWDLSCDFC